MEAAGVAGSRVRFLGEEESRMVRALSLTITTAGVVITFAIMVCRKREPATMVFSVGQRPTKAPVRPITRLALTEGIELIRQ